MMKEEDKNVHSTSTYPLTILHQYLKHKNIKDKESKFEPNENNDVIDDQYSSIKRTDCSMKELYKFVGVSHHLMNV